MKKTVLYFCVLTVLSAGCSSSGKLLEKGDYDKAIDKSIKKLVKDPNSQDDARALDKAYRLANERDLNRIKLLKSENKPENWEAIYRRYIMLDNRQEKVKRVLPLSLDNKQINYEMHDYTAEIVEAKAGTAEYYYNNGNRLMKLERKESYREAYHNYLKARQYGGSTYPDIEKHIDEAHYLGTSFVLIEVVNSSYIKLPDEFYNDVLAIDSKHLNSEWVEYHLHPAGSDVPYNYAVSLVIKQIDIAPEQIDRHEYVKERTVQDGFDYVLDRRGNVMKDSLGNDIKVPRYIDLRCRVIEKRKTKSVHIYGDVEIASLSPERILKQEPVGASSIFEDVSAFARGDLDALDEATLRLVEKQPLPFPDDMSMIFDCLEPLRLAFSDILHKNKRIIR